jgi:hypothetical protein
VRKIYALGFAAVAALPLAGCYTPEERAVGGALLGGATGAAIVLGAASGAVIGASTAPVYADPYYPGPPRVYAAPASRCWLERQPVLDSWGRVVAYQRVRVCG